MVHAETFARDVLVPIKLHQSFYQPGLIWPVLLDAIGTSWSLFSLYTKQFLEEVEEGFQKPLYLRLGIPSLTVICTVVPLRVMQAGTYHYRNF